MSIDHLDFTTEPSCESTTCRQFDPHHATTRLTLDCGHSVDGCETAANQWHAWITKWPDKPLRWSCWECGNQVGVPGDYVKVLHLTHL